MLFFTFSIIPGILFSQLPEYNLTAKNFSNPVPNVLEFDIYIEHTNSPTAFEYSGGQYFFNFNPMIANGGELFFSFAGDTSDLPVQLRPRNPKITGNQLQLASNNFPGAGNGYIMTDNGSPGTRIVSMKITTTAPALSNDPLNFQWRNALPDPFTKIYAYIGNVNTNVTSNAAHIIDTSGIFITYNIKIAIDGLLRTAFSHHTRRDTVTVYLANSVSPYNFIDSATNIIDSLTLSATYNFGNAVNGTYYLVIKHHNSIETWSKAGGENVMNGNVYNYDFTSSAAMAYGNNLVFKGSLYCIYSGDVNQDFIIDISDLSDVDNDVYNYASGYKATDFNGDYIVEGRDMSIIDNNRNKIIRNPIFGD